MVTSQPSHPSVTTHHFPSHPSQEVDYSTFPHLTSDTIEAKRNQSEKIKQRLLEAANREELTTIKQEFSDSEALLPLAQDESTAGEKVAQPCLVNRRVQVFGGTYIVPGVGVVEVDRGNGCVEVKMETGLVQIISKGGYQLLDEEVQ